MSDHSIGLDQLEHQLSVLKNDLKKVDDKNQQIIGAIRIVEYMIAQIKREDIPGPKEVIQNGN